MKRGVWAITLALSFYCVSFSFASDRPSDRFTDKPSDVSPLHVLKLALNLTEDQVGEIGALLRARAEATGPIAEEIGMLQRQMEEILRSDVDDPQAVGEIVLDIRALQAELGQIHAGFSADFHTLLTREQHQKIAQINRIALANRAAEVLSQLRLQP